MTNRSRKPEPQFVACSAHHVMRLLSNERYRRILLYSLRSNLTTGFLLFRYLNIQLLIISIHEAYSSNQMCLLVS
jgi:hypothetical protein